jgi:hypothetical protein
LSVDVERKVYGVGCGSLLLSGLSISIARAEEATVSKKSAYPQLPDPSKRDGPGMTVGEQQKLKNEFDQYARSPELSGESQGWRGAT